MIKKILRFSSITGLGFIAYDYTAPIFKINGNTILNKPPIKIGELGEKETVVVIGAGLMGLSTSYFLLQEGKKVILIEKKENVGMGTSGKNGCCMVWNKTEPWTHPHMMKNIWRSFWDKESPMEIKLSFLSEQFSIRWFLEAFLAFTRYKLGEMKNYSLGILSKNELDKYPESNEELDRYARGSIKIFEKEEFREDGIRYFEHAKSQHGSEYKVINSVKEMHEKEPGINPQSKKFKFAIEDLIETNVNTEKLVKNFKKKCEENPDFQFMPSTEISQWILNENKTRIYGVRTNKGDILGHSFVVSAGLFSKDLLWKLGKRLPLLGIKGYSITFEKPESYPLWMHTFCTFKGSIYYSQLGKDFRAAGLAEISGVNYVFRDDKFDRIIAEASDLFGGEMTNIRKWCGLRPVSADDVPIISLVKPFCNLYLNCGHGSKGTTFAFGSGKLLASMIAKKKIEGINPYDFSLNRFWVFK